MSRETGKNAEKNKTAGRLKARRQFCLIYSIPVRSK